jgi:hypothetical protein
MGATNDRTESILMRRSDFPMHGIAGAMEYTIRLSSGVVILESEGKTTPIDIDYRDATMVDIARKIADICPAVDAAELRPHPAKLCPHPIDSISLARVETKTNCKGEPFEKKIYYCEQCGAEFSL